MNLSEKINNKHYLKETRRYLRNNATPAERKLWSYLQKSKLEGMKFRRQHSIGDYIVDFYCPQYYLVLELDGKIHLKNEIKGNDENRTDYLNSLGIKVLRFKNEDVFKNIELVLKRIKEACIKKRF